MKKSHLILILFLLAVVTLPAQSHKRHKKSSEFDFTARAGLNFSQIDGDGSGNYDHLGFHAGVGTSYPLGEGGFRLQVEIALSQKGSHVNSLNRDINLLYVEVPLLLSYRMLGDQLQIEAGVVPAILGRSKVSDNGVYDQYQSANYKKMDPLPLCLGAQYLFSDHVGVNVRLNTSMLNIAKENGSGTYRIFRSNRGQFNRLISAGVAYRF